MIDFESSARESGPLRFEIIAITRVRIPFVEQLQISSGAVQVKDALLVRLAECRTYGWGEASAMSGSFYLSETPDSCQTELIEIIVPKVMASRYRSVTDLNGHLTQLSSNRFAREAIETAAWVLLARREGLSLCQFLGLPKRPVPSGLAVGLQATNAELIAAIRQQWPDGYSRLKIKIKRGQDIELVQAVRREMGDIPLFVDANADYTRDDFKAFQALDDYGLMMFEQPLAREDLEGAAALQKRVRAPICLDESIETAEDARRAAELGSCRVVNIKLQRVGGFLEAFLITRVCEASGIQLWAGTVPELGVGTAATMVLASHPAFIFPTDTEPSHRCCRDDVLRPSIELTHGCLSLPPGPGLDCDVDEAKLTRYQVQRWSYTAEAKSAAL